jgi:hypothetical protein
MSASSTVTSLPCVATNSQNKKKKKWIDAFVQVSGPDAKCFRLVCQDNPGSVLCEGRADCAIRPGAELALPGNWSIQVDAGPAPLALAPPRAPPRLATAPQPLREPRTTAQLIRMFAT